MGAVLAKFRKEKTTTEKLEKLQEEIKEIEDYTISTQARQKRYVGNFLVISIGLYVSCFIIFYFLFFPPTWMERISYSVPLLIFPLIIFLLKRLVAWFFQRKLNHKSVKLSKLRQEKKKVIEQVMDKETYKVALDILNRFGDKSNGLKPTPTAITPAKGATPNLQKPQSQSQQLIHRTTTNTQLTAVPTNSNPTTPISSRLQVSQQRASPMQIQQQQRKRTPFPIMNPQDKSVVEKLVDYLIGDGIQNRFAMICKECFGHNGMALQEEFEFKAFRCIYCNTFNPSKKSRPVAPKLPTLITPNSLALGLTPSFKRKASSDSSKTSSSEKNSGSDSDDIREEDVIRHHLHPEPKTENIDKIEKNPEEKKED